MPQPAAVPVLDLDHVTANELVGALTSSSCVFLTGHGMTDDAMAALLDTARAFYALPESEKTAVQWPGTGPWVGWQPVYAGGPQALLLERFELSLTPGAHTTPDGQPVPLDEWGDTFTLWPERPPGLRAAWLAAYAHLHGLASRVTTMIAAALGLPDDDLPAWTTQQHANLVVNHYFALDDAPEPDRVRQRAHTDIGGITLLWADDAPGGLEARIGPDGGWVPIEFPAGAWLLQAGDLLHAWSGGRIPANDHRVVNPPRIPGEPQMARYSVAYFHHPDLVERDGALDHVLARQQQSDLQDAQAHS